MKKFLFFLLLLIFFCQCHAAYIFAADKNIFGLHLTQTEDIKTAAPIINSSGGDWGWVTLVIRLDQLNHSTWQDFFDKCRSLHLIPILRLATYSEKDNWKRPVKEDIDTLANFLNNLNWPSKTRHLIFFNEPNHAQEWGGGIDFKNFADMSIYAYQKFKATSSDFYFISTGLDLAAPAKLPNFESAQNFYKEIYLYKPEYFDNVDALASHSYPNHGYIGLPTDTGLHSIRGYQSELKFIKSLGINKTFPVFITETGWPHREGEVKNNQFYTTSTVSKLLLQAIKIWQSDPRVLAITPFIYNYPHPPFDHFSWLDQNENLYPSYQTVIDFPKIKNSPEQITSFEVVGNRLPFIILTDTLYHGEITLKNTGQSIWGETDFCLAPESTINVKLEQICNSNNLVYPGQTTKFQYKFTIKNDSEYKDRTYISWQNLPPQEITPLNGKGTIYSPKTTLWQKIVQYFQSWFI